MLNECGSQGTECVFNAGINLEVHSTLFVFARREEMFIAWQAF